MSLRAFEPAQRVRHFHVVGGGCFGTQYVRWLLRARSLGMVAFEKIYAVDRDPQCRLSGEFLDEPSLQRVTEDWESYLSDLLRASLQDEAAQDDHWVPSPLSPHLLFLAFRRVAESLVGVRGFQAESFTESLPTPVRVALKNGDQALSFAEWVCPVNCIEPPRCPAIQAPRTWDMKSCLEDSIEKKPGRSIHVLQCRHFAHGVGTIPMRDILEALRRFLADLKSGECREVVVATTSGCHGLVSRATFLSEKPRSRSIKDLPSAPPYSR